jgi:hypothetical protein
MVLLILIVLMLACWRPTFLSRCRWVECGPVGGRAEVMDAGWLASVLECRQPGHKLQCINTACIRYAVSVRLKEFACLFDCGRFPHRTTFVRILQRHDTITLKVVSSVSLWWEVWCKDDISLLVLFEWTHEHIRLQTMEDCI